MIARFFPNGISLRTLGISSTVGLLIAIVVSLAVANLAATSTTADVQTRIVGIIFDSVAAGPVAFARLQSSSIANEQLARLMNTPAMTERGINSIRILSGPTGSDVYANWKSSRYQAAKCLTRLKKAYTFADALYPFEIEIFTDSCQILPEQIQILHYSILTAVLILALALGILYLAFFPMLSSLNRAERFLASPSTSTIRGISLKPIRQLLETAVRGGELEKNAAILEIATQVSHDIRSPLGALNMAVRNLRDIPVESRQLIEKASNRINQISNDLLSHAKVGMASSPIVSTEQTCVSEVLREVYNEKKIEKIREQNKVLNLDLSGPIDALANLDRAQLARALSNLINNSYESIRSEGTITLALRSASGNVAIHVSDNGCGMPETVLARLGKEKLTFGKSDTQAGTGRGVLHAKKSVEAMGGKFSIQSREGVGTIVTLVFSRVGELK